MNAKERRRLVVLAEVKAGRLGLGVGARAMGVSYRQAKRIWKRYREGGDAGLVHGLRGRKGARAKGGDLKRRVVERYRERYEGFGPSHAAEYLEREGMGVDHETLRRWLLEEGLWEKKRSRQKHRQWRERRASFGEMVQMDGSEHDWLEGRGGRLVLMVMVDDATNVVEARFFEAETTEASYAMMGRWIGKHGVPQSVYVDRDSIYRCAREPSVEEQVAGKEPRTQFGRAMEELGVELILANSPQAKGRVERMNGVLQERLVKEMRLEGIRNLEEANRFLEGYLERHNRRYARKAASEANLHRKAPRGMEKILSWVETRKVRRDWTVSWEGRCLQIGKESQGMNLVGKRVEIRRQMDGKVRMMSGEKELEWREIRSGERAKPAREEAKAVAKEAKARGRHPWQRYGVALGSKGLREMEREGRRRREAAQGAQSPGSSGRPSLRSGLPAEPGL